MSRRKRGIGDRERLSGAEVDSGGKTAASPSPAAKRRKRVTVEPDVSDLLLLSDEVLTSTELHSARSGRTSTATKKNRFPSYTVAKTSPRYPADRPDRSETALPMTEARPALARASTVPASGGRRKAAIESAPGSPPRGSPLGRTDASSPAEGSADRPILVGDDPPSSRGSLQASAAATTPTDDSVGRESTRSSGSTDDDDDDDDDGGGGAEDEHSDLDGDRVVAHRPVESAAMRAMRRYEARMLFETVRSPSPAVVSAYAVVGWLDSPDPPPASTGEVPTDQPGSRHRVTPPSPRSDPSAAAAAAAATTTATSVAVAAGRGVEVKRVTRSGSRARGLHDKANAHRDDGGPVGVVNRLERAQQYCRQAVAAAATYCGAAADLDFDQDLEFDMWRSALDGAEAYLPDPTYIEARQHDLSPRMRAILFDWMMEVCEEYGFHREALHRATNYVDRFLAAAEPIFKGDLQLVGVTALFVAVKNEEIYPPAIEEFVVVTNYSTTADRIVEMETIMLRILDWKIHPPTAVAFLNHYIKQCMRIREVIDEMSDDGGGPRPRSVYPTPIFNKAMSTLDYAVLDYTALHLPPALLAIGALAMVTRLEGDPVMALVSGFPLEDIAVAIRFLSKYHTAPPKGSNAPTFNDEVPVEDYHLIQTYNQEALVWTKAMLGSWRRRALYKAGGDR